MTLFGWLVKYEWGVKTRWYCDVNVDSWTRRLYVDYIGECPHFEKTFTKLLKVIENIVSKRHIGIKDRG